MTFLIDDVSVQATEPPGTPTDASIRFHVTDAATGHDITSGTVYVNRATGPESKPIKSNGYTDPFIFQTYGAYTFDVYAYGHDPLENQQFNVVKGQTGTIEVALGATPPPTGSLNIYSSPTGADIYLDGSYQGVTPLTISDIPVGSHTITAKKTGYDDLSKTVTVQAGTSDIPFDLVPKNSDPDMLPDIEESGGYRDPYGTTQTSNATLADTDGDGLTDDYEAGDLVLDSNGHQYRKVRSNPRMVDSDTDNWDDFLEDDLGTNPLKRDTDNDGLNDPDDDDPLVAPPQLSVSEMAGQLAREAHWTTLGFTFGETGLKDGSFSSWVGDVAASSATYFIGWMGSGVLVFGDVRDTGESVVQQDAVGTGLNLAAFVPLFGDGEKVAKNSAIVVLKYPAKAVDLFKGMVKYRMLDAVPDAHLPGVINMYLPGITDRLIKDGVTGKDLLSIARKGKLEETLGVIKRSDGKVIWLEEGVTVAEAAALGRKGPTGWNHVKEKHFPNPQNNQFADAFGDTYQDENKIKELIETGAKNGQFLPTKGVYEYIEPVSGKKLHVAVGSNGYIVSAFPFKG